MTDAARLEELLLRWQRLKQQGREATPEELCSDCPELLQQFRMQISALTSAQATLGIVTTAPSYLQSTSAPGDELASAGDPGLPSLRRQAGRYASVRFHARGGLGEVYLASDRELNREVALKRIQPQHANRIESRRRFLVEAEVTARLQHPGVVPVYGLVEDSDGQPCYAMRFIEGESLAEAIQRFHGKQTGYIAKVTGTIRGAVSTGAVVDFASLEFRQLLQRFVSVCNTIAYAHSRGVLHRDIKPQNIMVGKYGETLVVDWGLAKVVGQSPGAASSDGADEAKVALTTSGGDSSVTQIGQAIGTPAYMSPEQAAGRWDVVGPASDIYSLGATLYVLLTGKVPFTEPNLGLVLFAVQQGQFPPPRQVTPSVPRALEAVCLKAMARKPEDRYESALDLAKELETWLADGPVGAYAEPWSVRLRRWSRRNQRAVGISGGVILASVPLLILLLLNADQARQRAESDRESIQKEAARATNARQFFQEQVFAQVRPKGEGLGKDVTMKEVLDAAVPQIQKSFADYPEDEASISQVLAKSYHDLGHYDQAAPLANRSWELRSEHLGPEHPETLTSLRLRADILLGQGKYDEAEKVLRRLVDDFRRAFGEDEFTTRTAMGALAIALTRLKKFDEAERLSRDRLAIERRLGGEDDYNTLRTKLDLSGLLAQRGKYDEAEPLMRQAWNGLRRLKGEEHPDTLRALTNLAAILQLKQKWTEAEPLLRQVIAHRRKILGDNHAQTLVSLHNLGSLLKETGDLIEAEAVFREVLARRRESLSSDHPSTRNTQYHLADLARRLGKLDEAERLTRELIELDRKKSFPGTSGPGGYLTLLASIQLERGQAVEAEKTLREALPLLQKDDPKGDDNMVFHANSLLGASLAAQKRFDEAEPLLVKGYEAFKKKGTADPSQIRETLGRVIRLYEAWGRMAEASRWSAELPKEQQVRVGLGHQHAWPLLSGWARW